MRLKELAQLTVEKVLHLITRQKLQKIAGTIVFRKSNSEIKFLLLRHRRLHWDFPKGKIKRSESLEKAARRELVEETGIRSFRLINNFLETIRYSAQKNNGEIVRKIAFFYLVKTQTKKIKLSEEHKDFVWVNYRNAIKMLSFQNSKNLIKKANQFIKSNF